MATLNYSGEATELSKGETTNIVAQVVDVDGAGNGISVDSLSLRVNDGSVRLMIGVSSRGTVAELETLADTIAQGAVDLGFDSDVQTARESIDISGGVD